MEEARALLEKFWIDKEKDRELFYKIRRKLPELEKFFYERVGWRIISTDQFIKLEKLPAVAESYMGINSFQDKLDYCILCALLIYLEERDEEKQFDLQHLIEEIPYILKEDVEIDWNQLIHRKSLVRVLVYAKTVGIIKEYDGEIYQFINDEQTDVLYEKTELARYFSIDFNNVEVDFEEEQGKGRVNRVYRKLLTTPGIYWKSNLDPDSIYLRNQKSAIEMGLKRTLGGTLDLSRSSAFLFFEKNIGDTYPGREMLESIILVICGKIRELVSIGKLMVSSSGDYVYLTKKEFFEVLEECKKSYGVNWTIDYRNMGIEKFCIEVLKYMESWSFLKVEEDMITLYPSVAKFNGYYKEIEG